MCCASPTTAFFPLTSSVSEHWCHIPHHWVFQVPLCLPTSLHFFPHTDNHIFLLLLQYICTYFHLPALKLIVYLPDTTCLPLPHHMHSAEVTESHLLFFCSLNKCIIAFERCQEILRYLRQTAVSQKSESTKETKTITNQLQWVIMIFLYFHVCVCKHCVWHMLNYLSSLNTASADFAFAQTFLYARIIHPS